MSFVLKHDDPRIRRIFKVIYRQEVLMNIMELDFEHMTATLSGGQKSLFTSVVDRFDQRLRLVDLFYFDVETPPSASEAHPDVQPATTAGR